MANKKLFLQNFINEKTLGIPLHRHGVSASFESLIIEIGMGNGEYITSEAKRHPTHKYIGIDYQWSSVKRTLRRLARENLSNVKIFKSDAKIVFEQFTSEKSVDLIYALFPCPWPKRQSVHHRLFKHNFLRLINNRLKDTGVFLLVTDHNEFFNWVKKESLETGFEIQIKILNAEGKTRYARKWIEEGVKIFYELRLEKKQHISYPLKEEVPMRSYRVNTFDPDQFYPENITGDISVIFKEFLYDRDRQKGLSRVVISEEGLVQHLWICITREENYWKIVPSEGSAFIPTPGIQRALDLTHECIVSQITPQSVSSSVSRNNSPARALRRNQ